MQDSLCSYQITGRVRIAGKIKKAAPEKAAFSQT
jgi:hypothetical protein